MSKMQVGVSKQVVGLSLSEVSCLPFSFVCMPRSSLNALCMTPFTLHSLGRDLVIIALLVPPPLQPLFFLYTNEDMVFKFHLSHVSPCNICKRSQGIYSASIIYLFFSFCYPWPLLASSSVEHFNISRMKWISGIVGNFIVKIQGMFGCSFSGFRRALLGVFTCIFALGGAIVGIITGALKGQTTETGFVRGAGIGAVTGAVTAVQLLELVINGESLSKVALFCSLVDGKVFMEWVGPAVLKAYQWQVSTLETSYAEVSDIYDTEDSERGLSRGCIERLPVSVFSNLKDPVHGGCSICLQDFEVGEYGRRLPNCGHVFHLGCLDSWLIRCGSCPMCRESVYDDNHQF